MKPHKKIFEKKSFFRWVSIGGIVFLLLFQLFSLYQTYESISKSFARSIDEALTEAVRDYRVLELKDSDSQVALEINTSPKDKQKKKGTEQVNERVTKTITTVNNGDTTVIKIKDKINLEDLDLNLEEALYKMNSYILSEIPVNFERLDSVYNAELKKKNLLTTYNIVLYKYGTDSIIKSQKAISPNLKTTFRKELHINAEVQVFYENPTLVIFKKMLWFFIASVLLILIVGYALIYQLRIIAKQKQIEKIRRDFTDSMTHELRHPLQGALSMAEVLENPAFAESTERRTNAVKRIKHNLFNLSNLLESIVQKSYSDKLQQTAEWQDNNLKEMLNDLMANFTLLSDKKITFTTDFEDIRPSYQYDTVHFPNAIKNLIDNAIKYSNDSVAIRISVKNTDNYFTVCVADNGIGIQKKELPNIFDKFYRIYDKKKNHGFGLGLSYVKWVADIHSGRVSVKSEFGKGSAFSISIPLINEE